MSEQKYLNLEYYMPKYTDVRLLKHINVILMSFTSY